MFLLFLRVMRTQLGHIYILGNVGKLACGEDRLWEKRPRDHFLPSTNSLL